MVVLVSRSRRIVPGPESNNNFEAPTCIITEQELRCKDGTQVPEPSIVTFMPDLLSAMAKVLGLSQKNKRAKTPGVFSGLIYNSLWLSGPRPPAADLGEAGGFA